MRLVEIDPIRDEGKHGLILETATGEVFDLVPRLHNSPEVAQRLTEALLYIAGEDRRLKFVGPLG
jgi:hypothetical protein